MLEERLRAYRANPESVYSWDELHKAAPRPGRAAMTDRTTIELARLMAEELGGFAPPPGFAD